MGHYCMLVDFNCFEDVWTLVSQDPSIPLILLLVIFRVDSRICKYPVASQLTLQLLVIIC